MGGDCDGNFFVIYIIICEVLLLLCWKVVDLYFIDINELVSEFLMIKCNEVVCVLAGEEYEFYCVIFKLIWSLL